MKQKHETEPCIRSKHAISSMVGSRSHGLLDIVSQGGDRVDGPHPRCAQVRSIEDAVAISNHDEIKVGLLRSTAIFHGITDEYRLTPSEPMLPLENHEHLRFGKTRSGDLVWRDNRIEPDLNTELPEQGEGGTVTLIGCHIEVAMVLLQPSQCFLNPRIEGG